MNSSAYILIAGLGRSGTNWLLEILDQSRQTHCRNEPNECVGSAFFGLPTGRICRPELDAELELAWDEAVARTSRSFGMRDQSIPVDKDHFLRMAQQTGLVRLAQAKRHRKVLSRVLPSFRREEWPIPPWVVDKRQQDRSLPVHKLNMEPGWIIWALRNRPEAHVVHIVRHPGGYLNSLMKRLWAQLDMEKVARDNLDLLLQIAAVDADWADRFGDLNVLSPVETELWYWRYFSETIHQAGAGNPRYQLVKYEELTGNPLEVSRTLYQSCGLDWDETIEQAIRRMSGESQTIAAAWQKKLSGEQVAAVNWILGDSLMRDWWDSSGRITPDPAAGVPDEVPGAALATRLEARP